MQHKITQSPKSAFQRKRLKESHVARMESLPRNKRLIERSSLIWTIVVFLITCVILFIIGDLKEVMKLWNDQY